MYFKRGDGPLASILLPTRGRPQWLLESAKSLYDQMADRKLVEFVIKCDNDDRASIEMATKMAEEMPVQLIVSPRGRGYHDLHHYANYMSTVATGDWLFIFNDDARMLTPNWDQILLDLDPSVMPKWGGSPDICLVGPHVIEREISWEFPVLRRKTFQLLGHFSQHLSNDSWIYWVMAGINAAASVSSIKITHFINEIDDTVKKEGRSAINQALEGLNSPRMLALREVDRSILTSYLENPK